MKKTNTLKKISKYIYYRAKAHFYFYIIKLFHVGRKYSQCFVFCERGYEARDNAYFMFKYVENNHKEIKSYYIINTKSVDYQKVKNNAINYGCFKNYVVVYNCKNVISTHTSTCVPCASHFLMKKYKIYSKLVFLQHGITKDDIFHNSPYKLFICGAKPEYEFLKGKISIENGQNSLKYTGFARYDSLHDESVDRKILLMPSFRSYILSKKAFLASKYYYSYQSLINNSLLISYLEKNDITLLFYPHYEIQKYINYFSSCSKKIIIAEFDKYDVQDLLKKTKLLITDFSSVFFDFAYMNKPVIYYQFDEEDFFKNHYHSGYFSYDKNGFGKKCYDEIDVIEEIIRICNNGFKIDDIYINRLKNFFYFQDKNNCDRIFHEIIKSKIC